MKEQAIKTSIQEPKVVQQFESEISKEQFDFVMKQINAEYHDEYFVGVQEPEHDEIPSDDYSYKSKEYEITLKDNEDELIELFFTVGHSATCVGKIGDGYFSPTEKLISSSFNLEDFQIYIDEELIELSDTQTALIAQAIIKNYIP